jgi:hypothetical protein
MVHKFCLELFGISRDDEFVQVEQADPDIVGAFNTGAPLEFAQDMEGVETETGDNSTTPALTVGRPDIDDLHLDMKGSMSSLWNREVVCMVMTALKDKYEELGTFETEALAKMVSGKFERLRGCWKIADARRKSDGTYEDNVDIVERMNSASEKARTASRRARRRSRVSGVNEGLLSS